jgi:hypothetical protein
MFAACTVAPIRGGESSMDISADLTELGRTPVAVVCAGAKSVRGQCAARHALHQRRPSQPWPGPLTLPLTPGMTRCFTCRRPPPGAHPSTPPHCKTSPPTHSSRSGPPPLPHLPAGPGHTPHPGVPGDPGRHSGGLRHRRAASVLHAPQRLQGACQGRHAEGVSAPQGCGGVACCGHSRVSHAAWQDSKNVAQSPLGVITCLRGDTCATP